MTDTPKTDAFLLHIDDSEIDMSQVGAFCRDLERENASLLDDLESATRQLCHTGKVERDYNGQVEGSMVTDSGAISTNAYLLEKMADAGRFRIIAEGGRMVIGQKTIP